MDLADIHDIAIALEEIYPDVDILSFCFTDLYKCIQQLPNFKDDHCKCNEKILEAIQMAWLNERDQ